MRKFTEMYVKMQSMVKDEKGATMVEYSLMVALIAAVSAVIVTTLGTQVQAAFAAISAAF